MDEEIQARGCEFFSMKETILIAEDCEVTQKIIESELMSAGYLVHSVCDGNSAIESIVSIQPDLIITDYNMPNMNGIELLMKLHKDTAIDAIPVILIASDSSLISQGKGSRALASYWMEKPLDFNALKIVIQSLLTGQSLPFPRK
jgi:CheY-like chemotaxis protein